jgi:uncharacterized membrane protein
MPHSVAAGRPRAATIAGVPWWTIVCCVVFGVLVLSASIIALVATLRMLRSLGRFGKALDAVSAELTPRVEALSARSETAAANAERLNEALARLQASRERAGVLLWALEDVRRLLGAYRWMTSPK